MWPSAWASSAKAAWSRWRTSAALDRAIREVEVRFAGEVPFLGGIDGVFLVEKGDDFVRLRVTGAMWTSWSRPCRSRTITLPARGLELDEIFLSYYEDRDER